MLKPLKICQRLDKEVKEASADRLIADALKTIPSKAKRNRLKNLEANPNIVFLASHGDFRQYLYEATVKSMT